MKFALIALIVFLTLSCFILTGAACLQQLSGEPWDNTTPGGNNDILNVITSFLPPWARIAILGGNALVGLVFGKKYLGHRKARIENGQVIEAMKTAKTVTPVDVEQAFDLVMPKSKGTRKERQRFYHKYIQKKEK